MNATTTREPWRQGVTIGIPLYNEEPFVEAAIRSAAPQCEVLLVADNGSTDRSEAICRALAREHSNLVFTRHASNQGSANNFAFVLNEARTPCFMWLGAHDLVPPDYVRQLRKALDADATASLAYGAATHVNRHGEKVGRYEYAYARHLADDDPAVRLHAIIRHLGDCSLIHGLFRTAHLRAAWNGQDMQVLRGDHVLLTRLALAGKFLYVPATSLIRRDVHETDTPRARLERMTGKGQREGPPPSSREMQLFQYRLATQASRRLGWRAPFFRLSAWYWLVFRFGPFSESGGGRLVETVLHRLTHVSARKFLGIGLGKNGRKL